MTVSSDIAAFFVALVGAFGLVRGWAAVRSFL